MGMNAGEFGCGAILQVTDLYLYGIRTIWLRTKLVGVPDDVYDVDYVYLWIISVKIFYVTYFD